MSQAVNSTVVHNEKLYYVGEIHLNYISYT